MGVLHVQRSRILIVDTGLDRGLGEAPEFLPLLYAEPAELLMPAMVQRGFSDKQCVDANRNSFWRDAYGSATTAPAVEDEKSCFEKRDHFDLLQPYPRKDTSKQIYNPDHGSFVSVLAAGGPQLISEMPSIASYVGLTNFRVMRPSDDKALHVANEFSDIRNSIRYAASIGAQVINMSLKTSRLTAFEEFRFNDRALLVAAAGNFKENLDLPGSGNLPAALDDYPSSLVVVSAVQPEVGYGTALWTQSAFSNKKVHIAAPGALIRSYGANRRDMCESGTSAAAPLVSFTAAMLFSLTGAPRDIVRSRLLAAADHLPNLINAVEEGRQLNIPAALDVFVDRLEVAGGIRRGWLEPTSTTNLMRICKVDGGVNQSSGEIDPALLWEWWRSEDKRATIRHQLIQGQQLAFKSESCVPPEGSFSFFDLETRSTSQVQWSEVKKLLPTPFRAVKQVILQSDASGNPVP